jgi:peptide-methionine (S)-S-oxide reductase
MATGGPTREKATLGGGCFWCTEAVYSELKGVAKVLPGYAGGTVPDPTYEEVCTGRTGHAEVVQVEFDPAQITYREILQIFFTVHDPTTLNRQGADVGTQYRSVILCHSPEQKKVAEEVLHQIEEERLWPRHPVTEIVPLGQFYPAEEYHRDYFRRNPGQGYCQAVIAPKVAKFRHRYADRLRRPVGA